ncbi:hypothetical protein [Enterocloster lavalensis]|uniref:hypothetical protein n=1 Tax=Enterocloster lavalensis TaxID=460384 RepID=UPI00140B3C8C|nr:hypothetical protein [Enterocloster lavalensis]
MKVTEIYLGGEIVYRTSTPFVEIMAIIDNMVVRENDFIFVRLIDGTRGAFRKGAVI